jgi:radical SAM modification target selenobiotic family peptide
MVGGWQLDKSRLKKALAVLSVAGLIAGSTLTMAGCKTSCSSCSAKMEGAEKAESSCGKGSCGKGSCSGAKAE